MFNVYFCTGVESTPAVIMPGCKPASFETMEEAMNYVNEETGTCEAVDPRDNCIEGTSRECWWEIYDGPMVVNQGEDDEEFFEPVYRSSIYYNRFQ